MECKRCGSDDTEFVVTPEFTHYGKIVCNQCGAYQRWVPYPDDGTEKTWVLPGDRVHLEQMDDGDYEFTFGKHDGERLSAVSMEDPKYLEWMITEGRFPQDIKDLCAAAIKEVD